MKNAIIFHGTDCKPEYYWYQWLKKELENAGYKVELPYYPEINHEAIGTFLPKILNNHNFNEETILIGHSAGSPLILSVLEAITSQIKQAILIAGYYSERLKGEGLDPILQKKYDWAKIKKASKEFVFINSVEDPWGCDAKQGRKLFNRLGGTQIVRDEGHFGSTSYNQPYPAFPLLKGLILEIKS
ncbi:MAG TPA: alpha/beta hydrolase [Patescibacteria group bacterium]|nr:alpha/beta hydrolase [Patescibacteria group bacterium]